MGKNINWKEIKEVISRCEEIEGEQAKINSFLSSTKEYYTTIYTYTEIGTCCIDVKTSFLRELLTKQFQENEDKIKFYINNIKNLLEENIKEA